jgi:hypothetical protein
MFEIFKEIRGIKAFISEKQDGNMKLFSSDFEMNRKKYLNKIGLEYENLVSAKLEHGNQVKIVKVWEASTGFVDYCDGLLSQQEDVILSVTVADCFPVFLFDPNQKVIGILHCGWRSVAKDIIEKALKKMQKNFGCQLNQILVGIGPGIQKCHFEVEKELKKEFSAYQNFFTIKNGKLFLDLNAIIVEKLISGGILKKNIKNFKECTFCNDKFWSYRRDGVDENGDIQSMMATISMN